MASGGFIKFNLRLPEPLDVKLTFSSCAALVGGEPDCPARITVNGKPFADLNTTDPDYKAYSWQIPHGKLVTSDNSITLTFDEEATTQLFIEKATVEGD